MVGGTPLKAVPGQGQSGEDASYTLPDGELSTGCTLGSSRLCLTLKATGAIEKIFSVEAGSPLFGTVLVRYYDAVTRLHLTPQPGTFRIHPERQEHMFSLANGLSVREDVFALNAVEPGRDAVDPPAVYVVSELRNESQRAVDVSVYAYAQLLGLRGDVVSRFDETLRALVAWDRDDERIARIIGCSIPPDGFRVTADYAAAVSVLAPEELRGDLSTDREPLAVLHSRFRLAPGQAVSQSYLLTFSMDGCDAAAKTYKACPAAGAALDRTQRLYREVLNRSVVLTPNPEVNRGVVWAKANMLRVVSRSPTGWSFTNDPGQSSHCVGRDTAWFAFGANYLMPSFAREALLQFVRLQQPNGKIVEYYDCRTGETEDYGLDVNDNTPLLVLALWRHFQSTGDEDFLRHVYPNALRACRFLLAHLNEQGLVWCSSRDEAERGIAGWRNVIHGYRLSGAATELNAEAYAALESGSRMASQLGFAAECGELSGAAEALKRAINRSLLDPGSGLYYLNIDVDGRPRTDVTADLVFPLIFGVAEEETTLRILRRLSEPDFWTRAGMRTEPRDGPRYSPGRDAGLHGGVWVGLSFWYAFAAARYRPELMDAALGWSFQNYSVDPHQNNTVPGQFSEWLHGETLFNQGMMLSPWYPPRYLWAAVEGAAGFDGGQPDPAIAPRLAPEWKWLAVRNMPHRGRRLSWFAVRMRDDIQVYATFKPSRPLGACIYEEEVTADIQVTGEEVCSVALRSRELTALLVANTASSAVTTAIRLKDVPYAACSVKSYDSFAEDWEDWGPVSARQLRQGLPLHLEQKGFRLLLLEGR